MNEEPDHLPPQTHDAKVRAMLALYYKTHRLAPTVNQLKAWANEQRAIADAADAIAEEWRARERSIAPTLGGAVNGACMCDCIHFDDLAAILAEKGLDKRPAGK